MIEINYGAKDIGEFMEKLKKYTLDPRFEQYGNFMKKESEIPKESRDD